MPERRMVAGGTTRRFTATRWTRRAAVGAMLGVVASCAGKQGASDADTGASAGSDTSRSAEAPAVSGAGGAGDTAWVALVDPGASQWRGYKRQDLPAAWKVVGDTLAFTPVADTSQRGDVVTREQYGDFELAYEWKVSPGGNSGVYYRADEDHKFGWETGPEMQVLDNKRHVDGKNPLTSAGAAYALYAPSEDVTRPAGEWNEARIVARGPHVEHWLNGKKVVEYEQGSDDWQKRMKASKFKDMPDYGTRMSGHIVLQDHGDPVWYRNIRVRRLSGG
jgi:hypothetical protein